MAVLIMPSLKHRSWAYNARLYAWQWTRSDSTSESNCSAQFNWKWIIYERYILGNIMFGYILMRFHSKRSPKWQSCSCSWIFAWQTVVMNGTCTRITGTTIMIWTMMPNDHSGNRILSSIVSILVLFENLLFQCNGEQYGLLL